MPHDQEEMAYHRLTGKYRHFCPDWDFMAIDEHCREFDACTCDKANLNTERETNP